MNFRLPAVLLCVLVSMASAQSTRPATRMMFEPELLEALAGLDRFIPPDVLAKKRQPNERENKLRSIMAALLTSERPENTGSGQRAAANMQVADKAVRDQFARMRAAPENAAPVLQEQLTTLERLSLESIHLLDLLSRPASFPTARDSQLDLAKRLQQIPTMLDREDRLNRDIAHHERRLAVLKQIAAAEKNGGNAEQLAAAKETLEALDKLATAQAKLDAQTPLGLPPATQPAP